jgi:type IV secretion system protein VirB6
MATSHLAKKVKMKIAIALGKMLTGLVIGGIITYFVFCLIAPLLQMDKVIYRYEPSDTQDTYRLQEEVTINGNGRYTDISNNYGQWRRFNRTKVASGANLKFVAQGQVSLCQAYIPPYNLQQDSANDNTNQLVPIPRVEDTSTKGVPLILNATMGEWRNVANLFLGDDLIVTVNGNNESANVSQFNRMTNTTMTADCSPNQSSYSPICNRYTLWNNYISGYSSGTWTINERTGSHQDCDFNAIGIEINCRTVHEYNNVTHCCRCTPTWVNTPPPYISASNSRTIGSFTNLSEIEGTNKRLIPTSTTETNPYYGRWNGNNQWDSHSNSGGPSYYNDGSNSTSAACNNATNDAVYNRDSTYWWLINGLGLLSRHDTTTTGTPTNRTTLGSSYTALHPYLFTEAYRANLPGPYILNSDRIIYQGEYPTEGYYQLRIHDIGDYTNNNGGYVIYVKQTKCKRQNGEVKSDSALSDRGTVQVFFGYDDDDPNTSLDSSKVRNLTFNNAIAYHTAPYDSHIWVRIKNVQADYQKSNGSYNMGLMVQQIENQAGFFQTKVMGPLMSTIKGFILSKATTVFQNMVCYQTDKANCSSFFQYLYALLTLYIMSYGLLFWIGAVEISHQDLVIRLMKIAVVAGLMNDKTFGMFSTWFLPLISGATDDIISNLAGFTSGDNMFLFADPILSEVFFSARFWAKMLALTSVGPHGIIFFVMVFVSAFVFIMAIIQAIAAYFMAFCAQALLISIAPIFLSFMLFDFTKHLFDAWLKLILRYILEPVIILGGIIILTQMFTIILDYAMPYSVVIKCAIRIYSPFQLVMQYLPIPGAEALSSIPIFCLNGFVPWGFDVKDGNDIINLRFDYFIILLILSFLMYHYIPFASKITVALLGEGSSSTAPAQKMTSDARNAALKPIGMDDSSRAIRNQRAAQRRSSMKASDKADKRRAFVNDEKLPEVEKKGLKSMLPKTFLGKTKLGLKIANKVNNLQEGNLSGDDGSTTSK